MSKQLGKFGCCVCVEHGIRTLYDASMVYQIRGQHAVYCVNHKPADAIPVSDL